MKRRVLGCLLLIIILCSIVCTVVASDITPYYNNTAGTSTNFVISSSGKATVTASYNAYRQYFSEATITSYIEKRTLGIFWTKVDIGEANNEWVDTSSNYYDNFYHEFYLDDTGTYRATVVYEISGTGGSADVIEYEQERTYS